MDKEAEIAVEVDDFPSLQGECNLAPWSVPADILLGQARLKLLSSLPRLLVGGEQTVAFNGSCLLSTCFPEVNGPVALCQLQALWHLPAWLGASPGHLCSPLIMGSQGSFRAAPNLL